MINDNRNKIFNWFDSNFETNEIDYNFMISNLSENDESLPTYGNKLK